MRGEGSREGQHGQISQPNMGLAYEAIQTDIITDKYLEVFM